MRDRDDGAAGVVDEAATRTAAARRVLGVLMSGRAADIQFDVGLRERRARDCQSKEDGRDFLHRVPFSL